MPARDDAAALRVVKLRKSFVGQTALDDVSFEVHPGKVMALIGHNGSGKSTLIKILAGYHLPDSGESSVVVGGEHLRFGNPSDSRRLGLRFLHQDLGLVPKLSVLENLQLGRPWDTGAGWRIRWRRERRRAWEAMERVGLNVDPSILAENLGPIQLTQLAVARALSDESSARVLILDEPTAVLPNNEVESLFRLVRLVRSQGVGVIYVSHRLEEVEEIADEVTVLRNGQAVGHGPIADFPRSRLVALIVGEEHAAAAAAPAEHEGASDPRLTFRSVSAGSLKNVSFTAHAGEVLGVAGLTGSGIDDIVPVLQGRLEMAHGRVVADPGERSCVGPQSLYRASIAVLPVERHLRSLPTLTVRENLTLPDIGRFWRGAKLSLSRERATARALIDAYRIRPRQTELELRQLSGGNQQKVNIGKWIRRNPRVLVLAEPTQGVDVGGKDELLAFVAEAAERGAAVVICSSDVYELETVCTRVIVIRQGRIGAELSGSEIRASRISRECYGIEGK